MPHRTIPRSRRHKRADENHRAPGGLPVRGEHNGGAGPEASGPGPAALVRHCPLTTEPGVLANARTLLVTIFKSLIIAPGVVAAQQGATLGGRTSKPRPVASPAHVARELTLAV